MPVIFNNWLEDYEIDFDLMFENFARKNILQDKALQQKYLLDWKNVKK